MKTRGAQIFRRAVTLSLVAWFLVFGAFRTRAQEAASPTIIQSDRLEMRGFEGENRFYFEENVSVISESLEMFCDRLEIVAARTGDRDARIGEIGSIEKIVASGNVEIRQSGRTAFAGQAEMDPQSGVAILSNDPRIEDAGTVVSGWQIILDKEKRVRVLSDPSGGEGSARSRVILSGDSIPEFNFNSEPESSAEPSRSPEEEPVSPDEPAGTGEDGSDVEP